MQNQPTYLTTQQVADLLDVTPATIRRWKDSGELKALDDHPKYRMRQTLLFSYDDVMAIKQKKSINGWTTQDAAQFLNTTSNTIYNHIIAGQIKANKRTISNKKFQYVIPPDEVERIKQEWGRDKDNQYIQYYDRKKNVYLYQPFRQFGTQKIARVTEIGQTIKLQDEEGRVFRLETAQEENYKPLQSLVKGQAIQKKGMAKFKFERPSDIEHRIFDLVDWLMEHAGYSNLKINVSDEHITLMIKSLSIKTNNHVDDLRYLQQHCEEGTIEQGVNGIVIDSDYDSIHAYIPKELKQWVKEEAEKRGMSQSEFIELVLQSGKSIF